VCLQSLLLLVAQSCVCINCTKFSGRITTAVLQYRLLPTLTAYTLDVYIHHTAGYGGGGYPNAYPGGQQGGNGVSHMHHNNSNNSNQQQQQQQQQHGSYGGYMNSSNSGGSGRGDYSSGGPHSSVRVTFLKRNTSYSSMSIRTEVCVYLSNGHSSQTVIH
jgi:hypothetical protein